MLKNSLLLVALTLLLVGCGQPQIKPISLMYSAPVESTSQNDVKIALVKPKYNNLTAAGKANMINNASPFGALLSSKMDKMMPVSFRINKKFNTEYAVQFENSMFHDLEKILQSKGFRIMTSAITEDDITYSQKKNLELIIVPNFDIAPVVSVTKEKSCNAYFCTAEEGSITLGGKIYLNFIEPMSKEKMLMKTIDITSVANSGVIQSTYYKGYVSAQNAFVDMVNTVYPILLDRINHIIDSEEILTTIADIRHLKAKE